MNVINCIELTRDHDLVPTQVRLDDLHLQVATATLGVLQRNPPPLPVEPLTLPLPTSLAAPILYYPVYFVGITSEGALVDLSLTVCVHWLQQLCAEDSHRPVSHVEMEPVGGQGGAEQDAAISGLPRAEWETELTRPEKPWAEGRKPGEGG